MKRIHPKVELETEEEQARYKRYNAGLVAIWNKKRYYLPAGRTDDLYFWREGEHFYCLSINTRYYYVGLQVWHDGEEYKGMFLQEHEVDDTLGIKDVLNKRSPAWLFKTLLQYL